MKGVILVGGLGTRLLPMTRVTNKHLLPVGRFPMVYYPLYNLVEAGIREIMIVTGGNSPGDFLELLHDGSEFGLNGLTFVYQRGAGGIADALRLARGFVGEDRVAVMLGDNILGGSIRAHVEAFKRQERGAKILLRAVDDPERFGVAEIDANGRVLGIEEKPERPKSNLAVVGVYMYDRAPVGDLPTRTLEPRTARDHRRVNNAYWEAGSWTAEVLECDWSGRGAHPKAFTARRRSRANPTSGGRPTYPQGRSYRSRYTQVSPAPMVSVMRPPISAIARPAGRRVTVAGGAIPSRAHSTVMVVATGSAASLCAARKAPASAGP